MSSEIAKTGLSTRTKNALRNAGYSTVESIAGLTNKDLLAIPNLGLSSLHELRDYGVERPADDLKKPLASVVQKQNRLAEIRAFLDEGNSIKAVAEKFCVGYTRAAHLSQQARKIRIRP